jgi:GH15 family glucan-1,4-alpha-glucosidase
MSRLIEDYALIGDGRTAALVGRDGSIDWFCAPRFDSSACFAALVGDPSNGRWQICPAEAPQSVRRAYRSGTMTLETTFTCANGTVTLVDCMVLDADQPRIVRCVRGDRGSVAMRLDYVVRFDYGSIVPWLRKTDEGLLAVAGPDALMLAGDVETHADGLRHSAEFSVSRGERVVFELTYFHSYEPWPPARASSRAVAKTERRWRAWAKNCTYDGPGRDLVLRSLITLSALTYAPTGGILAAPTTSLPEQLGGVRNWDYRFCWLRDATFTLYALLAAGFVQAARDWRSWLLRAVADAWRRSSCLGSPVSRTRAPCGSVTTRAGNFNSTSTAR